MSDSERDPRRRFSGRERIALYLAADGRCEDCGDPLPPDFHADHGFPHSRGGVTDVLNGQALCPPCNRTKSDSVSGSEFPSDPSAHTEAPAGAAASVSSRGTHPASAKAPASADGHANANHQEFSMVPFHPSTPPSNPLPGWPNDPPLRAWQRRAVPTILNHQGKAFLLEACPAAGKTRTALRIAHEQLSAGLAQRIVVVCPTTNLATQWARDAASLGLKLEPNWSGPALPRDCHGIVVTYQRVAACPELYRAGCRVPTLVLADEPHHMGETAAWGQAFALAFEPALRWLLLSGTPFRSDNQPIPGVSYDADGRARPDFSYAYADAVRDGVCRKIAFIPFDGELKWSDGGTVIEATFADQLDKRQAGYRHRTALSPGMSDGMRRMIADADAQLTWVREKGHEDAGGLIVACDITHARSLAVEVTRITGESATVIASDDPEATRLLDRFRTSRQRWLVAVNMVSEGVDVPRLRVGIYATVAKTPLLFRQIVGRFVRVQRGLPNDPSYLFLPADPVLQSLADEVEKELHHQLVTLDDPEPIASEPSESEEHSSSFIPLDARVEAQGALMSGLRFSDSAQATAIDMLARQLGLAPEEIYQRVIGSNEPVLPGLPTETDYERRDRLRKERKRLVGFLHHRSSRDYSEIQTWINDAIATGRPVVEHTVPELERSIRLLTQEIARHTDGGHSQAA